MEKYKIAIVAVLFAGAFLIMYYFHFVLKTEIIYTHFFYIPTILASLWWKRKGLAVAAISGVLLLSGHAFLDPAAPSPPECLRVLILLITASVVAMLSERNARTERKTAETRDFLEKLIHNANCPIIIWDPRLRITRFNRAFEYLTGLKTDDVIGQKLSMLFPEDSRKQSLLRVIQASSGEFWQSVEIPIIRNDGEKRLVLWNSANIYAEDGTTLLATIAQGVDITERKRAEEALKESEEHYKAIWENSPIGICLTDRDGIYHYVNPTYCKIYGYSKDQLIGRPFYEVLMHPGDPEDRRKRYNERFENGKPISLGETRFLNSDGELIWIQYTGSFIMQDGIPEYLVSMNVDITEKKKAEEKIRQQNEMLKNTIESLTHPFYVIDASDYTVVLTNSAACSAAITKDSTCYALTHRMDKPCDSPDHTCPLKIVKETREPVSCEHIHYNKNGDKRIVEIRGYPIFDGEGNVVQMIEYSLDITERKRAEEALRESEERFRTLVENQGEGVGIVDPEERFVFANPAAHDIFGVERGQLLGRSLEEFLDPEQFEIARKQTAMRHRGIRSAYELEFNRGDGEKRLMLVTVTSLFEKDGKFKGALGVFRDMTDMRKMEEELLRSEKLESLGLLAGGIAHDFNNTLTAILGNISMVKAFLDKQDEIYSGLEDVEKAALQAQALTYQLLTFSKGGAPVMQTASIVELAKKTAGFTLSGSNVRCEYSISDDIWGARFDAGQIGQVIQNLIINADQAMPEGGILKLDIVNIYVKPEHSLPLEEGKYVRITIRDQGTGIPEKHLDKIFDPFFTTKLKGNGLGLATAYSIIKKHNGYINVESQIEEGTTFYIYLPASDEKLQLRESAHDKPLSGTGKILVVDDEEFIRDMLNKMLTRSGYTVRCTADGWQAIEMYKNEKEQGEPFDAVLMDLTIPGGIGGREAIKKLREIDPDAKAIVSSGYSNDPIMADYTKYGFNGCLAKPYRASELNKVLSEVLNEQKVPA